MARLPEGGKRNNQIERKEKKKMKKIMMLLAATLLVFSLSGNAAAYFEEGHLIQVVYERGGTKEIVTDLGALTGAPIRTETTNLTLSKLGATSWDNVYVAYFMRINTGGIVQAWTSGTAAGQSGLGSGGNSLLSKIGDILGANVLTGLAQNVRDQSLNTSFSSLFGTTGNFGGFLTTNTGEENLAALGTGGMVTQYLYFYNNPTNSRNTYTGQKVAIMDTKQAVTDIKAVPIPATVYLLGSGLLGLIGIRRRKSS